MAKLVYLDIELLIMSHFLTVLLLFVSLGVFSQVTDDFSDLDFTNSPTWAGTNADFLINANAQLQSNGAVAGTSYLSTEHNLQDLDDKEWRFWARISTAPSGSNFAKIYLTSSSADLTSNPDGFYIQLGEAGSTDAVRLMKSESGVATQICASTDGTIAASFIIGIRVFRDNTGVWSLFVDFAGGEAYSLVGSGTDASLLLGTHIGYWCTYTASNSTRYYLDNVYAGNEIVDTDPPTVVSVVAVNQNLIDVLFSESVDQASAEDVNNYDIQPFQSATSATRDLGNLALVHIVPFSPLNNGQVYTMFTSGIEDLNGNASLLEQNDFGFFTTEVPVMGDVIINEFMCDPDPQVGLPNVEFVEVYNRSNKVFNLQGWKLGDNSSFGTVSNTTWLLPGGYTVLCATNSVDSFSQASAVTSFPSLNNTSDDIVLQDNLGVQIDKISYTQDWYHDPNKEDGGYTIERINPTAPCSSILNWKASSNSSGGSPGVQNSVFDLTPDTESPFIVETYTTSGISIKIDFNEGMDSTSLQNAVFSVTPNLTENSRFVGEQFPLTMDISFAEQFQESQTYQYTLSNVADCWSNVTNLSGEFALPADVEVGDVVINEIVFNPLTGGSDWVELYNKSEKLLNLKDWSFARFQDDTLGSFKVVTNNYLLKPDDYVVVGADSMFVTQNYPAAVPGKYLQMALPSLNTDSNTLYVLAPVGLQTVILDKLSYSDDWHFRLLDSDKGKSLERLNPDAETQDPGNWHTAAEAIGFGTPGAENSQYYPAIASGTISFTSETVSPDNDGFEDVLQINYELEQSGLVGTITIYDDRGRKVRDLTQSELLGNSGTIVWDGTTNDETKASIGTYVLVFEAFDVNGGLEFVKRKAFVVAGVI